MTITIDHPTPPQPDTEVGPSIPQYSRGAILAIWAAAAVPMGVLSWIVAPMVSGVLTGPHPLVQALLVCLAVGLVWQGLLVLALVWHEQRNLRWSTLRDALWLRAPRSPKTGRRGGRAWLITIPLIVALVLEEVVNVVPIPGARDFAEFLSTHGEAFFDGAWGWFGVMLVMVTFNTVLGEELLFRGFLLPRMNGAFGERDWVANGVLFAAYHLHVPWAIPASLLDTFILAYPSKQYRSVWIGIVVHSAQSVFIALAVFALVV